jgi:hypothetical protein|tara:strand:+ start:10141 stop:10677 length:537 start_codon:yes stop_codon:yes gene_type:complete
MTEIPHLNIDELYERKKEVDTNRLKLYNKLISKVHHRIKVSSRQQYDNEFCYFVMPEILIGYPNYNYQECLMYILNNLQDDGFLTKYVHPNLILISWRHWIPHHVRDEIKKQTGKIVDKFGNQVEETDITDSHAKKDNGKKVHFQKKQDQKDEFNKLFKPSGKFIYGNDVLSKIKEVL